MRLRRFSGATTSEALRRVKEALGPSALILSTQQGPGGEIEITAAVDFDPAMPAAAMPAFEPQPDATARGGARAPSEDPAGLALVHRELRRLSTRMSALDGLLRERAAAGGDLGVEAQELAAALESSGLARRIASPIAADFERELASGRRRGDALAASLGRHLPVAAGRPSARISMFVGPSGAGKTTTIAKLAAVPAIAGRGRRPALILTDTHRVGAAEHLGAFARLFDVPLRVAQDPAAMREALSELGGCDPILVDTAGFANDGERRRELSALIESAGEDVEVTAVVSATTSTRALERAWEAMRLLAPRSCVMTKLDECEDPGEVCTWFSEAGLPLRWLGTGHEVPGGLIAANGASLAEWLVAA